jgi:hypothetical protein
MFCENYNHIDFLKKYINQWLYLTILF